MKPAERRNEILTYLRANRGELRVLELAKLVNVSSLTIRRDLDTLSSEGAIVRTHGGCRAVGRAALERGYHRKVASNFEHKQAIGRAAAEEVHEGDTLILNDGSTTFHLAANLKGRGPLTIYTNSLAMISELTQSPDITIYILGGRYNRELYTLEGGFTEHVLESCRADVAFLGADAVSPEGRCLARSPEVARLTRSMLRSGRRKVLLADHTKLGDAGYFEYGSLEDFDLWITSCGIDAESISALGRLVHIVEVAATLTRQMDSRENRGLAEERASDGRHKNQEASSEGVADAHIFPSIDIS